jgi:hypothetical protein
VDGRRVQWFTAANALTTWDAIPVGAKALEPVRAQMSFHAWRRRMNATWVSTESIGTRARVMGLCVGAGRCRAWPENKVTNVPVDRRTDCEVLRSPAGVAFLGRVGQGRM